MLVQQPQSKSKIVIYSPSCWKVARDFLKSAGKAALFCRKQAPKEPSDFWTSLPALAVARALPGMTVYETNQQILEFGWIWVQDGFDSRVVRPWRVFPTCL